MPADSYTGKTFIELVTDFAVATRMQSYGDGGSGIPLPPTSEHDLYTCKRAVNQGYREFLRSNAEWTFIRHPVEITFSTDGLGPYNVAGDSARYRLPNFLRGMPRGNLRYVNRRTAVEQIIPMPAPVLERYRSVAPRKGIPMNFCVRPIEATDPSGGKDSELVVYPSPSMAYTVRGEWRVEPYDLRDDDERHIAGSAHDEAILSAALHLFFLNDTENPDESARWSALWAQRLEGSKNLDKPLRVRNRGPLKPTRSAARAESNTTRPFTFTLDGQPIPQD